MLCAIIVECLPFELTNLRDVMTNSEEIKQDHRTANLTLSRYLSGAIIAEISDEKLLTMKIKELLVDTEKKRTYIIVDTEQQGF